MQLRSFFLSLLLCPVILAAIDTQARAQTEAQSFDCVQLLAETGLGDASAKTRQQLMAAPLTLTWSGDIRPDRRAPVVLVPLLSGYAPRPIRSVPAVLDDGIMSCTLIGVAFRPALESDAAYTLSDLRGGPRPAELPVLLVGRYDSIEAADLAFRRWAERGFPLPVAFPEPVSLDLGSGKGTQYQVFGDHRAFEPLPLLGDVDWGVANTLAVNPARAPDEVKILLRAVGVEKAGVILTFCGSESCGDFRRATPDPAYRQTAMVPQAPAPVVAPAPVPVPVQTLDPTDPPASVPSPSPEAPVDQTVSAPNVSPRPADRQSVSPSTPAPGAPALRLTYLGRDGREEDLPPDLAGRLDCVLAALGAEVFLDTPDCSASAFDALRDRRALLRRLSDSHWQIVAGAKDRPPHAVVVTLPAGQSGAACRMDLDYDGASGPVRLALNPVAGSAPAQFTAIPVLPIPVRDGLAQMRLAVNSPAACGGASRMISVPTAPVVTLSMTEPAQGNRAVLYVIGADANDWDVALGLDPGDRAQMAGQLLGAIEAAQARLAAGWGDAAWSLSSVSVARLDETEGLVRLISLSSEALRDGGVGRGFAALPAESRLALADMRPRVTPDTLAEALRPAIAEARARGISDLTLNLIAPVTPRTAAALTDPCGDLRFASLAKDLTTPDGPRILVSVFPLVRLRDGDSPDLNALQPLSFDPESPTRPGGLTRCQAAMPNTVIYPFFIEPWRPDTDISGRYTAALADRLALSLSAQLSKDQARP